MKTKTLLIFQDVEIERALGPQGSEEFVTMRGAERPDYRINEANNPRRKIELAIRKQEQGKVVNKTPRRKRKKR